MAAPVLNFLHGPIAGRRIALEADEVTVGRSSRNDVEVKDPIVSRVHAIFMRRGGATLIEDLGSQNGTFVNDERLHGIRQLHNGDKITMGGSRVLFEDPNLLGDESTQVVDRAVFASQNFTQRQLQVLRLISRGLSNKQIGERLFVSERTVKAYLTSIMEKLGVNKRAAAVAAALRLGLIEMPGPDDEEA